MNIEEVFPTEKEQKVFHDSIAPIIALLHGKTYMEASAILNDTVRLLKISQSMQLVVSDMPWEGK